MDLGEIIRHYRNQRDWTQAELGERAKVDSAQMGRFERGQAEPKLRTLYNIADAFKVEVSELLDDVPRSWKKASVLDRCDTFRDELQRALDESNYVVKDFDDLVRFIKHHF